MFDEKNLVRWRRRDVLVESKKKGSGSVRVRNVLVQPKKKGTGSVRGRNLWFGQGTHLV